MLSNASQYAVRSVLYLALNSNPAKRIGAREIAEKLDTPKPFLAKLLQQLAKTDLVSSTKGPSGGFFLSAANRSNSIWDIIVQIDGRKKFHQCFLGLEECGDQNPCPVHSIVSPLRQKILEKFMGLTIDQFAKDMVHDGNVISLKDLDLTS